MSVCKLLSVIHYKMRRFHKPIKNNAEQTRQRIYCVKTLQLLHTSISTIIYFEIWDNVILSGQHGIFVIHELPNISSELAFLKEIALTFDSSLSRNLPLFLWCARWAKFALLQIVSMAAFELFVRELMEWKLALLAVPTLIIAWLICKFLFLDAFMSPLRNLPGPPTSMFLGNFVEIKRKDIFGVTLEWSKKYGGIFVMWLRPGMYVSFRNR